MYRIKRCLRCKKTYRPKAGNQKYCPSCKPIIDKLQNKIRQTRYRRKNGVRARSKIRSFRTDWYWDKKQEKIRR